MRKKTGKFRVEVDNPKDTNVEEIGRAMKAALDSSVQKYSIVKPISQAPTVLVAEVQSALATDITIAQALRGKLGDGVKVEKVE
ncbi:hypothetical protein MUP77_12425 [Candidatus Bathyarchaeota archaeon]|nr:hypothetical protein [Candidatus Bathyarchaeota archaeon]